MSKQVICPLAQQGKCPEPLSPCDHREAHIPKDYCNRSIPFGCGAGPCVPYVEATVKENLTVEPPKEQGYIIPANDRELAILRQGEKHGYEKAVQSERQRIIGLIADKRGKLPYSPADGCCCYFASTVLSGLLSEISSGQPVQYNTSPSEIFHSLYAQYSLIGVCRGKGLPEWPNEYQVEFWQRLDEILYTCSQPVPDPADAVVDKVLDKLDSWLEYSDKDALKLRAEIAALKSSKEGGK